MRKIVILTILIFVLEVLDNTMVPLFSIYGYIPSLLFIFVLCYSIINDRWSAVKVGLISGALQDLFFINGFGVNTLLNMLICVLAGEIGRNLFKEKRLMPVLSILLLTFLKEIFMLIILHAVHINMNIYASIIVAIYSFVVAIFVYKPVYKLCRKPYMIKKWKF
ncbi:rod shape-determining protein MreD [Clostridium acidisoli DSM 12555]|uniref:Rod shape-determining protein MreD n=1 Tax=Clostridium acidisoli DSM 12555 TaxID=1121291 RepID=A0A1W1X5M4_9CLOT|nr:rod shape-determining protein MreD [Clostridium acidisoli]SMC19140.1 rod shape-determining protein MreD [Clostridium acidisoli DSM 12555]